jgi:hypothetical protein
MDGPTRRLGAPRAVSAKPARSEATATDRTSSGGQHYPMDTESLEELRSFFVLTFWYALEPTWAGRTLKTHSPSQAERGRGCVCRYRVCWISPVTGTFEGWPALRPDLRPAVFVGGAFQGAVNDALREHPEDHGHGQACDPVPGASDVLRRPRPQRDQPGTDTAGTDRQGTRPTRAAQKPCAKLLKITGLEPKFKTT